MLAKEFLFFFKNYPIYSTLLLLFVKEVIFSGLFFPFLQKTVTCDLLNCCFAGTFNCISCRLIRGGRWCCIFSTVVQLIVGPLSAVTVEGEVAVRLRSHHNILVNKPMKLVSTGVVNEFSPL